MALSNQELRTYKKLFELISPYSEDLPRATRLSIERIVSGKIEEDEILKVIALVLEKLESEDLDEFDYLIAKYSDAIEYHYGQPQGTFMEVVCADETVDIESTLEILKKSNIIHL